MNIQNLLKNPKIIKQIDYEFNSIETSHDKYKNHVVYCRITGDECDKMENCKLCETTITENGRKALFEVIGVYPTIKKNKIMSNYNNTIIQAKTLDDLGCLLWISDSIHYKNLTEEQLSNYNLWNEIKDIYLETDEIVDFMYRKNYPLIINFKNSVLMISP